MERGGSVSLPFLLVLLFYYSPSLSGWLVVEMEGLCQMVDLVIGFVSFLSFPLPFVR
jgi:hypothetical protein